MCIPGMQSGKSQRNAQIWEQQQLAEQKAIQNAEAEKSRQAMLAEEAARKTNILTGNTNIDNAFGGFNDSWFGAAKDRYVNSYLPDLKDQQAKAADKLKAALVGRGMYESTAGANAMADLERKAADARAKVGNDGQEFANNLRSSVESSRNNLYQQSAAAADPSAIARSATGEATTLANQGNATPSQPLGDIFSSFLSPFVQFSSAYINSPAGVTKPSFTLPTGSSGSNSSWDIVR